jgi:hypothetical protein
MNLIAIFYNIFYSENYVDNKLKQSKREFELLNLNSNKVDQLTLAIEKSKTKANRIKHKLDLNFEYQFCINHHFEIDII